MPRRRLRSRPLLAALALILIALGSTDAAAQSKPNIVIMVADDAGYADFGFMNQFTGETTEFKTPNLDALAAQSVAFSTAYVAAPVCSVSRAGFLTGRAPAKFGVDYNFSNANSPNDGIPTGEVMIQEALKQNGYATGAFGKWHIGAEAAKQPINQGFDEFFGIYEGSGPFFGNGSVRRQNSTQNGLVNWTSEASFNNIPNDPALGRHITDAYGDEASKFIATHANQSNPFFMYVPFTAPHSPYTDAKASDIAEFDSTSLTGLRKNVAALTYAMDRAVGNIINRINDPNGDGNTSDSVANNTIIVFLNDNGGNTPADPPTGGVEVHDNGPLRDWKGSALEGGIRVPMLIKAPGLAAGVFEESVIATDLVPTFLSAAGIATPSNLDGVNLMPYLTGVETGAVHDKLYWRGGVNQLAIRKGDWKLVKANTGAFHQLYHLNPDGSGEFNIQTGAQPAIFQDLMKDFVDWETTLQKPSTTTAAAFSYLNRFDAFRFRTDLGVDLNWRDLTVWRNDASPSTIVTMVREDSYANAVLVFQTRDDASYTSRNNISRASGISYGQIDSGYTNPNGFIEFMLNELRFNGQFGGATDRSATLTKWPLMFTKNLAGAGPKMSLDATSAVANKFTFYVNMDVVLHDSLEITGNGTQNFEIGGQMRDFRGGQGITKTGSSTITLSGNNIYTGATIVNGGTLRVAGASAALGNTASVQIGAQGTVKLESGLIRTPLLQNNAGGTFNFTGGTLETSQVAGSLVNNGGTFKPGASTAIVNISGSYVQNSGTIVAELGGVTPGAQFDQVVAGNASLAGSLQISLINAFNPSLGNSFEILKTTNGVTGAFSSISAPALGGGKKWALYNSGSSISLLVVNGLAADFDHNNIVNQNDLSIWRTNWGTGAGGDADLDGDSDGNDFLIWQRERGLQLILGSPATAAVPEPNLAFEACAVGLIAVIRRIRSGLPACGHDSAGSSPPAAAWIRLYRLFQLGSLPPNPSATR